MVFTTPDSIVEGCWRRVCPLYGFDERDRIYLRGSAVPFELEGFQFLITAGHVCMASDGTPTPLFTVGENMRRWPLTGIRGAWQHMPGSHDIDVAVIGLDSECAADLGQRYLFVSQAQTAPVDTSSEDVYMIAGYPHSRNKTSYRGGTVSVSATATCLITPYIQDPLRIPATDKTEEHHFGLMVPAQPIRRYTGGQFGLPSVAGMSGGGVWRLEVDANVRLLGEPRLAGIGIEFHRQYQCFVAARIDVVIPLANDLRERIRDETV